MLSINTNLSSLIAQSSNFTSSLKLDQAVERLTTGYKINHAKDNAANYSISTNMTTKIGSYMVAEDNCLQGLDFLTTASDSLSLIEDNLNRLRALATQANNGTYSDKSMDAINAEANAIIKNIETLNSKAEFNGIKLFNKEKYDPTANVSSPILERGDKLDFIVEVVKRDTSAMTELESVDPNVEITDGIYSISSVEELVKLGEMTNNDLIKGGEFVLACDLDLSSIANWTPIGCAQTSASFRGVFDGNGCKISNLTITTPATDGTGLFGKTAGATVKNLAVVDANIKGYKYTGIIAGQGSGNYENCYATGTVKGSERVGGFSGAYGNYKNCFFEGDVIATGVYTGGLVGYRSSKIEDCYTEGSVTSSMYYVGGIIGYTYLYGCEMINCYSSCTLKGSSYVGGLIGHSYESTITGSYFDGVNLNSDSQSGGLIGQTDSDVVSNCYFSGKSNASGLVGWAMSNNDSIFTNCGVISDDASLKGIFLMRGSKNITFKDCYYNSSLESAGIPLYKTKDSDSIVITIDNAKSVSSPNVPFAYKKENSSEPVSVEFQVGVGGDNTSRIALSLSFSLEELNLIKEMSLMEQGYISNIDNMLNSISLKQTEYGAVQNRLESVLDEISIQYDNLVSSRSTIRDADIAEVSAQYIQQQILQQASATLLATANQSPAIALQLI